MRSIIKYLTIVLVMFLFVGCSTDTKTNNIKLQIGESSKFSKQEINKAVDCLTQNFDFPASTLTKISYDETKSNKAVDDYLKFGKGSENKSKPENIIVLLSDFDVDNSGDNPVLNPGETYVDYQWILIRDNKNSNWKIDDWGY